MNGQNDPAVRLYLDLMKQCLTRLAFQERFKEVIYRRGSAPRLIMAPFQSLLRLKNYTICTPNTFSAEDRRGRP